MEETLRDKSRFYDEIAESFDEVMNRYDLERRLEMVFDNLLAGVELRGRRVLDVGCGTGYFSLWARERGAEIVSLDLGPNLLAVTRRKGPNRPVCADAARMPFPDAIFDVVLSSECIEHTPLPAATTAELARVLRPGGTLALTCPNRFWYWSCWAANRFGLRSYQGIENWPGWWSLEGWLRQADIEIERHVGLHLFPFVMSVTQPLLRWLDRAGSKLGPFYVNQCVRGKKGRKTSPKSVS